jgi:hypothetical protein
MNSDHLGSSDLTPESLSSDRELLELAAKAAGIELHYDEDGPNAVTYYGPTKTWGCWNPLTDDGDALRLAVKLGMFLDVFPGSHIHAQAEGLTERVDETWGPDPYAATRRAIVRAAAALAA